MRVCEACPLGACPLTGNFWEFSYLRLSLKAILAETSMKIVRLLTETHISLLYWRFMHDFPLEVYHTDCSIRVSRSFAKFPMTKSDLAKQPDWPDYLLWPWVLYCITPHSVAWSKYSNRAVKMKTKFVVFKYSFG